MTLEDLEKLDKKLDRAFGASSWIKSVNRAAEQINQAATAYNRTLSTYVEQAQATRARTLRRVPDYASSLQLATEQLEAGQRNRINRVVLDWQRQDQIPDLPPQAGFLTQLVYCLLARRRRAKGLEAYLGNAHNHPAVARAEGRGRRLWFERWRRAAITALHLGLDPGEFASLTTSPPAPPRRHNGLRPARGPVGVFHGLLERLAHSIAPNAPGVARLQANPSAGDGLPATI